MVSTGTGLELASVILGGVMFIAAYKVFSFFRRTALGTPLLYMSSGFYLFFLSLVLKTMDNEFGFGIPFGVEVVQLAFFILSIDGLYGFYRVYPFFADKENRIEKTVEKIEEEMREDLSKKRKRTETELKIIKMRFMKRELNQDMFNRLWIGKEKELTETEAALRDLKPPAR